MVNFMIHYDKTLCFCYILSEILEKLHMLDLPPFALFVYAEPAISVIHHSLYTILVKKIHNR